MAMKMCEEILCKEWMIRMSPKYSVADLKYIVERIEEVNLFVW